MLFVRRFSISTATNRSKFFERTERKTLDSGFPYGDIIVIAAIAAFVILRYRAMLGEKHGRDAEGIPTAKPLEEYERIVQIPSREAKREREKATKPKKDYGNLNDTLSAMRAIDRQFSPEDFIEGARGAYEMIIEAYNKHDDDTLRLLLSPKNYDHFKAALAEDEKDGRRSETTLVAIVKAEIADAKLRGNTATVTVDFLSEQVPLVRDAEGTIIEGDVSHQSAIEDRWVFERDLSSADPNWKIIET